MTTIEPLEDPANARLMYFPLVYPLIDEFYVVQSQGNWTFEAHAKDFTQDHANLGSLPEDIRLNIEHPLVFLAIGDSLIADNIDILMERITIPEGKRALSFQQMMELCTHNPTYSHMVMPFLGTNKKDSLMNKIRVSEPLRKKQEFMSVYFSSTSIPLGIQLAAAVLNEGLFFASSFAYIFWCKEKGYLPGIAKANEMIARDEWTHTQLSMALFRYVVNKPSQDEVHELFRKGVDIEVSFAEYSIVRETHDMSLVLMQQYVQYLADVLLELLGYDMIYNVECPFDFMTKMGLTRLNDFFTSHSTEYKDPSTYINPDKLDFSDAF